MFVGEFHTFDDVVADNRSRNIRREPIVRVAARCLVLYEVERFLEFTHVVVVAADTRQ